MESDFLWAMDVLENPGFYKEKSLQRAIEVLWDVLFHEYKRFDRSLTQMPSTWQPDITAYSKEENVWLIIELKTKPPSGSRAESLRQVTGYAWDMLDLFPAARIKPILIGPWDKGYLYKIEDVNGMKVQLINVMNLGQRVHQLFENMVRWCLDVPFPSLRVEAVADEWVRALLVVIGDEENEHAKEKHPEESYSGDAENSEENDDEREEGEGKFKEEPQEENDSKPVSG